MTPCSTPSMGVPGSMALSAAVISRLWHCWINLRPFTESLPQIYYGTGFRDCLEISTDSSCKTRSLRANQVENPQPTHSQWERGKSSQPNHQDQREVVLKSR